VTAVLAGHLARARELLAEPSPPGLFDLASRVGALEEVLATICDDVESERRVRIPEANAQNAAHLSEDSRIIPPCPECTAVAKRNVTWTGGMPGGGDSWRCTACSSVWTTEAP